MSYETKTRVQRFILVGVSAGAREEKADASLDELADLLETAGGEEAGRVLQNLEQAHPKTYVGSGKVQEIKTMLSATGADGIICDDELSPAQLRALSDLLDTKIIDRTLLILDIFSQRASTKEGQLQIELAQLEYRLTRLTGLGTELSRQGAAVGTHTRGAGETKLEMDRRHIRARMDQLKSQLKEVEKQRSVLRAQRQKKQIPVIALVGYTNAGKSTLFNRLTHAQVKEEDQLFATLDTTTRRCKMPSGRTVLFVDTVGFIHKLPHHLIKAFRATLEEAAYADVILKVCDGADPEAPDQLAVTDQVLTELGCADIPQIVVYNKWDLMDGALLMDPEAVCISAKTGYGIDALLERIEQVLSDRVRRIRVLLPYDKLGEAAPMREHGTVLQEEYREDGLYLEGIVKSTQVHLFEAYLLP